MIRENSIISLSDVFELEAADMGKKLLVLIPKPAFSSTTEILKLSSGWQRGSWIFEEFLLSVFLYT